MHPPTPDRRYSRGLRANAGGNRKGAADRRRLSRSSPAGTRRRQPGLQDDRPACGTSGAEACGTGAGDGKVQGVGSRRKEKIERISKWQMANGKRQISNGTENHLPFALGHLPFAILLFSPIRGSLFTTPCEIRRNEPSRRTRNQRRRTPCADNGQRPGAAPV